MLEWFRENPIMVLPAIIMLGLFLALIGDMFFGWLNDPPRQINTNSESEQSYQITPSRSNQER